MAAERTSIRRLRIRDGGRDGARAALHAERLLASVSFRPPGLSPSAVLCVRNLRDPSPGGLRLESTAVRAPPSWEAALEAVLDRAVRNAARPALEAVPARADAVLFGDRSELLACLAADWLRHEPRWWWPALLAALPSRPAVACAWAEEPRYAPAALELLAERGLASPFAEALRADEVARLAGLVAGEFALPWLGQAVETLLGRADTPGESLAPAATPRRAPWLALAPEAAAERLDPVRRLFVGATLALRRAPVAVRGLEFARAATGCALIEDGRAGDARAGPAPRPRAEAPAGSGAGGPRERGGAPGFRAEQGGPDSASAVTGPRLGSPGGELPLEPLGPADHPSLTGPQANAAPRPSDEQAEPLLSPAGDRDGNAPAEPVPSGAEPEVLVETQLGGIFFLTGFALRLGLIPDFSAPERRGLGLHPWELLSELGRRMLDGRPDDPVWDLLEELAGGGAVPGHAHALSQWLDTVADYARARLAAALGVDRPEQVPDLLLRRPARVSVSPVHVDVLFPMAAHPIEIRLAGLDSDPGWLPAAGRHLRFRFE